MSPETVPCTKCGGPSPPDPNDHYILCDGCAAQLTASIKSIPATHALSDVFEAEPFCDLTSGYLRPDEALRLAEVALPWFVGRLTSPEAERAVDKITSCWGDPNMTPTSAAILKVAVDAALGEVSPAMPCQDCQGTGFDPRLVRSCECAMGEVFQSHVLTKDVLRYTPTQATEPTEVYVEGVGIVPWKAVRDAYVNATSSKVTDV